MPIVASDITISPNCPKYLQPLGDELQQTAHRVFHDEASLLRFLDGVKDQVNDIKRKYKNVQLSHHEFNGDGELSVFRENNSRDDLVFKYINIVGSVHVSHDGRKVFPQDYIDNLEGGAE